MQRTEEQSRDAKAKLTALLEHGMTLGEILEAISRHQTAEHGEKMMRAYADAAANTDLGDSDVEFDKEDPVLAVGDDGARVLAWVWIGEDEIEIDEKKENDEG